MDNYIKRAYISELKFDLSSTKEKNKNNDFEVELTLSNKYFRPKDCDIPISNCKLVINLDIVNVIDNKSVFYMTMIYSLSFEDNAEPEIDFIKERKRLSLCL